jgi:hypothetical protein
MLDYSAPEPYALYVYRWLQAYPCVYNRKYIKFRHPSCARAGPFGEAKMIDPDSIEDVEDCDGEGVFSYGLDSDTGKWCWGWVPIEHLYEYGRTDIIDRLFPVYADEG